MNFIYHNVFAIYLSYNTKHIDDITSLAFIKIQHNYLFINDSALNVMLSFTHANTVYCT